MLEREGIQFLDYSEDPSRGISLEKNRIQEGDVSIIWVIERLLENKEFFRSRRFDEKEGDLRSFVVSYPAGERTSVEYESLYSPEKKSYAETLLVNVDQVAGAERLGQAWYDENGFLSELYVYPLASGYQKFDRALQEEGIDLDSEEGSERTDQLMGLTTSGSLRVLLLKGKKFFLKGVLQEDPKKTVDVGIAKSGEAVFWDEYYYRMTEERSNLVIEVFSGTKERALKKRLVFPLEVQDFREVLKLFIEDEADWRKVPELIPVEVDFPTSA